MQRALLTNEFDSLCSTFIYILYTISVSISRIIWRGGVIFNINSVFIEERERERDWDWVWLHHNLHFSRTCRACRAHSLHWHSPLSLSTVDYLLSTSTNISYSCLHHLDLLPHWQWEILLFFFRISLVLHIDYQELSNILCLAEGPTDFSTFLQDGMLRVTVAKYVFSSTFFVLLSLLDWSPWGAGGTPVY